MSAHHNLLIGGDTRDARDTATQGVGTLQGGTEGTARDAGDWVFAANKHEGEVPRVSRRFISRYTLTLEPSRSIAIKIPGKLCMIGWSVFCSYLHAKPNSRLCASHLHLQLQGNTLSNSSQIKQI